MTDANNACSYTMKDLPESERPYEKCESCGAASLSDAELLAIILRTGAKGKKAIDTACELLNIDDRFPGLEGLARLDRASFTGVSGIGRVKALQLEAVCELARRISRIRYKEREVFDSASLVAEYYMTTMRDLRQEELHIMMLDTRNSLIREKCLTVGTVNASLIDPREIFITALENRAVSIILVHNHPSGNVSPSEQDLDSTKRVRESGRLIGIALLDHLIIGNMNYISLRESGYL